MVSTPEGVRKMRSIRWASGAGRLELLEKSRLRALGKILVGVISLCWILSAVSCASSEELNKQEHRLVLAGTYKYLIADYWLHGSNGRLPNQEFVLVDYTGGKRESAAPEVVEEARLFYGKVGGLDELQSGQARSPRVELPRKRLSAGPIRLSVEKVVAHENDVEVEASWVEGNLSAARLRLLISRRGRVLESKLLSIS